MQVSYLILSLKVCKTHFTKLLCVFSCFRHLTTLSSNSRFATDSSLGNLSMNATFHTQREIKVMSALDSVFSLLILDLEKHQNHGKERRMRVGE